MRLYAIVHAVAAYGSSFSSRHSSHCPSKGRCNAKFCGNEATSWEDSKISVEFPDCPPGVAHLWDDCNCCQKCAKQIGDKCDVLNPCDHTKGLACLNVGNDHICGSNPDLISCKIRGEEKATGVEFHPGNSCELTCVCVNGDIGCYPTCPSEPPKKCQNPRLEQAEDPSACCGVWTCGRADRPLKNPMKPPENKTLFGAAHRTKYTVEYNSDTKCMVQTTEWSKCSRDCGWGIRERITNANEDCEMEKETKLCQVRPCDREHDDGISALFQQSRFRNRMCLEKVRVTEPMRFQFSGCKSNKKFRPKYCGKCKNNNCCNPDETETVEVDFTCETNGEQTKFSKKMDMIKSCKCSNVCGSNISDLFSSVRLLDNDMWH